MSIQMSLDVPVLIGSFRGTSRDRLSNRLADRHVADCHLAARKVATWLMVGAAADGGKKKKYTKATLPSKLCSECGLPMNWRKKWEKVWDEVKYCSERCRRAAKGQRGGGGDAAHGTVGED